ncbi:NAD(P)/FAD-dependent oxidoreductase [Candidatus Binatus sp.]|uniref:NAD(P)/FAD-dependent oxidoreductase n=1 Tax=Candidatus Binatus sp. TaxID=2811406 RepID=UPI002F948DCB
MASTLAASCVSAPASEIWDLVVVGGGPAGLAVAIVAAEQGLSVVVVERRDFPPDKACGEGVLPPGVQALERLGIANRFDHSTSFPFAGIRFIQENGSAAEALMPSHGMGIRRTVLVEALARRAEELGAVLRNRCSVTGYKATSSDAVVYTTEGEVFGRLVVAADGLHSSLRKASGLEAAPGSRRRFALRQHYKIRPWTDFVEVYVDAKGEAVVTPVSDESVGINFVWEDGAIEQPKIPVLANRFPALLARLGDAPAISSVRGAGPMARAATRRNTNRMVLVGDAAGFVDSISGDGLSIAFNSALILGRHLPEILKRGATRESMQAYEREARRVYRGYWFVTSALLMIARHPRARQTIINSLMRHPRAFSALMGGAMRMMVTAA